MAAKGCNKCHRPESSFDSLKKCSKCKVATYCSPECQKEHWALHRPICKLLKPGEVWGIELLSKGELRRAGVQLNTDVMDTTLGGRFRHILLTKQHIALSEAEPCPATKECGIPLRIYSEFIRFGRSSYIGDRNDYGNTPAVRLRIEPGDGTVPPHWQINDPGTCIIYREDRRPLTLETIETIYKFHDMVLTDATGYPEDDGWASLRGIFTPVSFQLFSRKYFEEENEKGRPGFDQLFFPL